MSDERFDSDAGSGGPPPGTSGGHDRRRVPTPVRVLLWVVLIAAAVVVLFTWVFPWVESIQQDPTLGAAVVALVPPS